MKLLNNEYNGKFLLSSAGEYNGLLLEGDEFFLHGATCILINTGILIKGKLELLPSGSIYVLAPYDRIYDGFKQWIKWEIKQEITDKKWGGEDNEDFRTIVDYSPRSITTDEEERLVESGEKTQEEAEELSMPRWNEEKLQLLANELVEKFFLDKIEYSTFRFDTEEGDFYSDKIYNIGNTREFSEYDEVESNLVEKKKLQEEVDVKLKVTLC